MPRIDMLDQMDTMTIAGPGTFSFSAVRPDPQILGASEYTLVGLALDVSGSVVGFKNELLECVKNIISACKKSERAENLMIRLVTFNSQLSEVHGFKELHTIDPNAYSPFNPFGGTALIDAVYSLTGSILTYSETLINLGYNVNGICFIVTDGDDNSSTLSAHNIKELLKKSVTGEKIESLTSVLVGLNDPKILGGPRANEVDKYLSTLTYDAGITQYVKVGNATPQRLAKLAEFVSRSVSSQSQALGSGSPSIPINLTI